MAKRLKLIAIFICVVVVVQWAALLFFTPGGIEKIYPYFVRFSGEVVSTETNSYGVYYDTRAQVAGSDIIVIGVDYNVAQSWEMLGHFSRFLKQYTNFSTVILDMSTEQASLADGLLAVTSEDRFYKRIGQLEKKLNTSVEQCEYIYELYYINRTVIPARKFDIVSYRSGNETDEISEAAAVYACLENSERSAICIVDSRLLEWDSGFREELSALTDNKAMYFQTHYTSSCASADTHMVYAYPFENINIFGEESEIRLLKDDSFDFIYSYYDKITGMFGKNTVTENRLDERNTDFFFLIKGGTGVTYVEEDDDSENAETSDSESVTEDIG